MEEVIRVLVQEHENIRHFTEELEKRCIEFMEDDVFDIKRSREDIHFIRSYADKRHHKKEEDLLFRAMIDELGTVAENLVRHGMMAEHDTARLHVMTWEKALDAYEADPTPAIKLEIITNAMAYCYLLRRHIDKENEVVYPFAERSLDPETFRRLREETRAYEEQYE